MAILRVVVLPFFLVLMVLSGCQTSPSNHQARAADEIIISHPSLSQLSADAVVSVVIEHADTRPNYVDSVVVDHLPYRYALKSAALSELKAVKVEVKIGNDLQLMGSALDQSIHNVELKEVAPQSLPNTFWKAVDISGRGIPLSGITTLAVLENGKLAGYAGCNQYRSEFSSAGAFINIRQPLLTRKICSSPVMYHENRYLQLLQTAEYFQIESDGKLKLFLADSKKPIIFEPSTQQAVRLSLKPH